MLGALDLSSTLPLSVIVLWAGDATSLNLSFPFSLLAKVTYILTGHCEDKTR